VDPPEACKFGPPDGNNFNEGAGMGGIYHLPVSYVHANVVGRISKEHQMIDGSQERVTRLSSRVLSLVQPQFPGAAAVRHFGSCTHH
jgi:hypothetical protein